MKSICGVLLFPILLSCSGVKAQDEGKINFPKAQIPVVEMPEAKDLWVFILAGQSNMAGRGLVAPEDTISHPRIMTVNPDGQLIYAKEPLHFYEPNLQGLDCGLAFAKRLIQDLSDSVSILLLPTAVGGSAIEKWLGDSTHRGVKLLSNFEEKVAIGLEYGTIKAILWHQGESNANINKLPFYQDQLKRLIEIFRSETGFNSLPMLIGELPGFPKNFENRQAVNKIIHRVSHQDKYTKVIHTQDLMHKGDSTHFNAESLREMGVRFAEAYLEISR